MKIRLFIIAFIINFTVFSQATEDSIIKDNTLKGQFDELFEKSGSYQNFKIINKSDFDKLKKSVSDSINQLKATIKAKNADVLSKNLTNEQLNEELNQTKISLQEAIDKESSFNFLGMQMSKTSYNAFVWILIFVLLAGVINFAYKYSQNNVLTKNAQKDLEDLQKEFDEHRKNTIEREQKLRRKLHDEINKNKTS